MLPALKMVTCGPRPPVIRIEYGFINVTNIVSKIDSIIATIFGTLL